MGTDCNLQGQANEEDDKKSHPLFFEVSRNAKRIEKMLTFARLL